MGAVFAYVALRTGGIRYTVLLHFLVNLLGMTVSQAVVDADNPVLTALFGWCLLAVVAAGTVILWRHRKKVRLRCGFVRGQETFSFEYDPAWLSSAESSFSLDPDLALYRGRQYVPLDKRLFGLFADSCPDRWGRLLMRRKEAIDA